MSKNKEKTNAKPIKKSSVLPTSADEIPEIGNGGLRKSILTATLIPLIFSAIILVVAGSFIYSLAFQKQVKEDLHDIATVVLQHYDYSYPGNYNLVKDEANQKSYLYKGDVSINDEIAFIDETAKNTDTQISMFFYDMRLVTTLTNSKGQRLDGTIANANLVEKVLGQKKEAFFNGAEIEGDRYCVYYIPFFSNTGTCLGMIGVAKPFEVVTAQVSNLIVVNSIVMIILLAIMAFCVIRYTDRLVGSLKYIREYLAAIAEGNLDTELNMKVVARQDEIGDMGRLANFLRTSLKKLVERDPLTNLNNRRSGVQKIKNLKAKAERNATSYSVAMGDIDFFKKVNDTYGHDAGDTVLKEVAKILRNAISGHGTVIRWGGEEFLMLLDGYNEEEATEKLWSILEEIRAAIIVHEDTEIKVTMSIGIVGGNTEKPYEEEITAADGRLYFAKEHGRNRVIAAEADNEE